MRKDFFASIGLLLIAAVYYATATTIPASTLDEPGVPGPSGLPTVLAAVLAIIAIALGARALAAAPARGGKSEEKEAEAPWPRALGHAGDRRALHSGRVVSSAIRSRCSCCSSRLRSTKRQRPDWRLFVIAGGGALFFWFIFDVHPRRAPAGGHRSF